MSNVAEARSASGFVPVSWSVRIDGQFFGVEGDLTPCPSCASRWSRFAQAELVARAVGGVVERAPSAA